MNGLTHYVTSFPVALGVLTGTIFGLCDRECVDLRSGIKCVLSHATYSITVSIIVAVAFKAFMNMNINPGYVTMPAISAFYCSGLDIFKLSNQYILILKLFFDHII